MICIGYDMEMIWISNDIIIDMLDIMEISTGYMEMLWTKKWDDYGYACPQSYGNIRCLTHINFCVTCITVFGG